MHIQSNNQIIDSDMFIRMIDESKLDDKKFIDKCNDEVISIECIGERNTYDIDITGNHLYFANDILTHNSATGANLDIKSASNSSISDSLGSAMAADFILFILQTEEMKEKGLSTFKVTKNRFNGRTDFWNMNVDYTRMRFSDVLIDPNNFDDSKIGMQEPEIAKALADIKANDIKIVKQKDNEIKEDIDVLAELGLT